MQALDALSVEGSIYKVLTTSQIVAVRKSLKLCTYNGSFFCLNGLPPEGPRLGAGDSKNNQNVEAVAAARRAIGYF